MDIQSVFECIHECDFMCVIKTHYTTVCFLFAGLSPSGRRRACLKYTSYKLLN